MTDNTEKDNNKVYKSYSQELSEAEQEGQQSLKRKQKERKIRKQRKKLKMLKAFLRFIVFVMLILCVYVFLTAPQWYLKSDTFSKADKKRIIITNNKIVPSSLIYESIKDIKPKRVPIFLMRVAPIKKRILKISAIKNVYIRRYGFPARIDIIVRERIPAAVIKTDLNSIPSAFFATDGKIITDRNCMTNLQSDKTLVILSKTTDIQKDFTRKKFDYIKKIAKSTETYSQEKVEYIDMRNPNDVYVKIETTNVRLGVPDSTVFERIKRIYTILPQISEVNGTIKYIDLSWDKVNYLKMQQKK